MKTNNVEEFFGTLLYSDAEVHKSHLKTTSHKDHVVLNDFYTAILDDVDNLIETYQGLHGKVGAYKNLLQTSTGDAKQYLLDLQEMVRQGREDFCKESELQSICDTILEKIASTLYKLTELTESRENNQFKSLAEFLNEKRYTTTQTKIDMDLKRITEEVKNGAVETHYSNGQLESRANYENNKLDGLYETWYENGKPKTKENYKNGKRDGLYEFWWENGKPRLRTTYKNRKRDGQWETWHENGQTRSGATYKNDKLEGLREVWYESGQIMARETYKNDKLEGLREVWHENGKPKTKENYKNGKLDGLHNEWDEKGNLVESTIHENNQSKGLAEFLNENLEY